VKVDAEMDLRVWDILVGCELNDVLERVYKFVA
jgi:hypothetical protein